jgi:hypothetical protein
VTKQMFAFAILRTRLIKNDNFATIWRCYKLEIEKRRENLNVTEYNIIPSSFVSWSIIYLNCNLYVVR